MGVGVLLDFDDDAHTRSVRFFTDVRDAFQAFILDHVRNRLDERRFIDLIGNFGNDNSRAQRAARFIFLNFAFGADDDVALAGAVGFADTASAHDDAARREVGRGDIFHELLNRDFGVVDHGDGAVDDLGKVVGRNIGCHTHGDTVRTVDQEVGIAGGQNEGFFLRAVEVGEKIYGVLIQVAQQLGCQFGQPCFGVTHCSRRVAVHAAEVTVPVYKGKIDGKILRQTGESVVYRAIAVRVVLTQDVADDSGALAVRLVAEQPHFVHGV